MGGGDAFRDSYETFRLASNFCHKFKSAGVTADTFFTEKIRLLSGIGNEKSGFLFLGAPKTELGRQRGAPEGALSFLSIRIRLADQPWTTKAQAADRPSFEAAL